MTPRSITRLMVGLLAMATACYVPLPWRININWDEFRFLSDVHALRAGDLAAPLQTFHAQLFRFLPYIGNNEIDQIVAGRAIYFVFLLGSCLLLYQCARRFMTRPAAVFVLLCFLAYSNVIAHGTAFRYDGLSLVLLLAATALLLRPKGSLLSAVIAGVLTSAALLVTVKSVFYFPILILALIGGPGAVTVTAQPNRILSAGAFGLAAIAGFCALYFVHKATLVQTGVPDTLRLLQNSGEKVLLTGRIFPAGQYLERTILANAVIWLIIVDALVIVTWRIWRGVGRSEAMLLASLLAPLASVTIYRNAFPYFYVLVIPPVLILCGLRFDQLVQQFGKSRRHELFALIMVAAVAINFLLNYPDLVQDRTSVQRRVVEAVHEVFPEPTPYIDRNSMIASYPKVGIFMSTWGMEDYLQSGRPIFERILRDAAPKFLVANHPALILDANKPAPLATGAHPLLEEDFQVLRDNFIHHWGPIYVAGKRFTTGPGRVDRIAIVVPGPYTLEAPEPVNFGGQWYEPGAVMYLGAGSKAVTAAIDIIVTLRWGDRLHMPDDPAPVGVLYYPL